MAMRSVVPFGWGGPRLPSRMTSDDPFVRLWNDVDRVFSNILQGTGLADWQSAGMVGLPVEV